MNETMDWKYYRLHGVSKWVLWNNWITKHDEVPDSLIIGINGERVDNFRGSVRNAKIFIENKIRCSETVEEQTPPLIPKTFQDVKRAMQGE